MRSDFNVIAFGLAVAGFAAYQQFKLPVVLPVLLDHYHYDRFLAGSFMSVYALIGLLLSLKLGSLIKRRGVVALIQVGLALFVGGAGLTLAFPEFGWIVLLARSLEGLGFAIMAIGGPVLANSNAAPRHPSRYALSETSRDRPGSDAPRPRCPPDRSPEWLRPDDRC